MRTRRTPAALGALLAVLALAACNDRGGNAPGAVSEGEAQALEEAAEMLDERQLPEGALPPVGLNEDETSVEQPETPQEATQE